MTSDRFSQSRTPNCLEQTIFYIIPMLAASIFEWICRPDCSRFACPVLNYTVSATCELSASREPVPRSCCISFIIDCLWMCSFGETSTDRSQRRSRSRNAYAHSTLSSRSRSRPQPFRRAHRAPRDNSLEDHSCDTCKMERSQVVSLISPRKTLHATHIIFHRRTETARSTRTTCFTPKASLSSSSPSSSSSPPPSTHTPRKAVLPSPQWPPSFSTLK